MTNQWYCCIASQQYGPLPFEQLQQWAAEGRLQPDHHVCLVGQQQWSLAGQVPGLFAAANAPAGDLFAAVDHQLSQPGYPQQHYQQPTAGSGFAFQSGATRNPTRSSSVPKKKETKFNWTAGLIAGGLALIGGISQLAGVFQNAQEAEHKKQQEIRRQQQVNRVPKLPPITAPKVYVEEYNNPKKRMKQPWER